MRQPIFCGVRSYFVFLFLIAFLFFDFPKHTRQRRAIRGRSAQSRGRRDPENGGRMGDGEQQTDGGGARVRREENKDRTQSNQQQLNA